MRRQAFVLAIVNVLILLGAPSSVGKQETSSLKNTERNRIQSILAEKSPDPQLERAVLKTMPAYSKESTDNENNLVRYYYNRVDLNGDRKLEVLVYLSGSYTCGSGGCTTLIFQNINNEYRLVSSISIVNNPIIVSKRKTSGWNDLIMYVAGGGARPRYAVLRFNGRTYPDNPSLESTVLKSEIEGRAYVADDISADGSSGIVLRPAKQQ